MSFNDKIMFAICMITLVATLIVIGYLGGRQEMINKMARGEITITTNTVTTTTYEMKLK